MNSFTSFLKIGSVLEEREIKIESISRISTHMQRIG